MATNINVERLKSSPLGSAWAKVPDIPIMPKELTDRSPLYAQWNDDLQAWWRDVKAQLDRNQVANTSGNATNVP